MSIDIHDDSLAVRLRRAGVPGSLTADDPGFPFALSGFNLAFQHRPEAVVSPTSAAEVATAVRLAADYGRTVHVLGLGHGLTAPVTDGVTISTRGLAGVRVDPAAGTASVGAGTSWAEVLEATAGYGLAPLCGSAPGVGVIGYLLGGGIGPVARTYGFAADHIRSFTVVTADGAVIQADAEREPDLFWALRGGKSGFGVVVEATIDLFPIRTIVAGGLFFAAEDTRAVLRAFATWTGQLPETVTTSIALLRLPPAPEVPEPLRGRFVSHVRVATVEPAERAEELLRPLRAAAHPLLDTVTEIPYAAIGSVHADPVQPMPVTSGGVSLRALDEEAVEQLLAVIGPAVEVPLAIVELRLLGGALARPAAVPNAVGGRDAAYALHVVGAPVPELLGPAKAVTAALFAALEPWRGRGAQINFYGDANDPATWSDCWPQPVAERLQAVRAAYDPHGRFGPVDVVGAR